MNVSLVFLVLLLLLVYAFASQEKGILIAFVLMFHWVIFTGVIQQVDSKVTGASDFTLTTYAGEEISLSDYRGQVVVLNFWASWCAPCELQAPVLQSLWETYQDQGVVIIGITYVDSESKALESVDKLGLTYITGADLNSKIADLFGVQGIPETFVIDQSGAIKAHFVTVETDDIRLAAEIDQLLGEGN